MTLLGVDIHPRFQAGISIEQIRREGFDFMACKLSEGTNHGSYTGSIDWLRRGQAVGLLCLGYHYLRAGNEVAQADVFCDALERAGVPGMLDVEDGAGGLSNARRFLERCQQRGAHIPLVYLPRWYWQRIGSPHLAGLPPLWASRYPSTRSDTASGLYSRVPGHYWDGYGGNHVEVLQFTDRAQVAGRRIDANAYRGTREQLAALLGGEPASPPPPPPAPTATAHSEDATMHEYTPEPAAGVAKRDWPTRTVNFGFDDAKVASLRVHFGERGGWIHKATWWVRDPNWNANIPLHFTEDHPVGPEGSERFPGYGWIAACPVAGADELQITFSAPDGMHIFPAYK